MNVFIIESTNPELGWIIFKNPSTNMIKKQIRHGIFSGFYPPNKSNVFIVSYIDSDTENSYAEVNTYNNASGYNSPIFALNTISEFFNSTMKQHNTEKD